MTNLVTTAQTDTTSDGSAIAQTLITEGYL